METKSDFEDLQKLFEKYKNATTLLRVATHDYADARCLLKNGLTGGLISGTQSMEKYLKAYLLFTNPNRKVKNYNHSILKLLQEVASLAPHLSLLNYSPTAEKFQRYFDSRYPDNPNASSGMSTGDLLELDDFIVFLNEKMCCPHNVRYTSGYMQRS